MDNNTNKVEQLGNLAAMINGHLASLEKHQEELGKVTEMLAGILDNDPSYKEVLDKAKAVTKEKSKVKADILKQPHAHDLNFKIKEARVEIKQLQEELSRFLFQYFQVSGSNQFEGDDGEMRTIVYQAKLVGKTHFADEPKHD